MIFKKVFGGFWQGACLVWKVWSNVLALAITVLFAIAGWEAYRLAQIWPDFGAMAVGAVPKSKFIAEAEATHGNVRWQPVALTTIDRKIADTVILAEDVRFWRHYGVDLPALGDAIERNIEVGHLQVGGSTISQQTVKNLFLHRERTLRRKGTEVVMTLAMERNLDKERILEIYLNIAQFGPRIYGVEAAMRHYFGKSATAASDIEAASLAASLPSPSKHNPETATREFERRRNKILWFMAGNFHPPRDESPPQLAAPAAPAATVALSAPTNLTSASLPITDTAANGLMDDATGETADNSELPEDVDETE